MIKVIAKHKKPVRWVIPILILPWLVFIASCDFNKMAKLSSNIIVKIPWKEKGETHFTVQNVELKTLKQLSPLEGDAANIYIRPEIHQDRISGTAFEIEYTYNSKKEVIPLNRLSAQALTLYAHMERLYLWSSSLNLPPELKTKLDVGLAADFMDSGQLMKNNALFSGALNAMLVVPYTTASVPLSLNGGVLAHEYFHFLFNGLVGSFLLKQQKNSGLVSPFGSTFSLHESAKFESDDSISAQSNSADLALFLNRAFIRGINEGLADVWGWLYSEDTNFISPSLPIIEKKRELNIAPRPIWTKTQMTANLRSSADMRDAAEAIAYDLGTQFARWTYTRIVTVEGTTHLSDEQRNKWSNIIIERLVNYSHANMSLSDNSKMVPSEFIVYILFGDDKLTEAECKTWSEYIEKSERITTLAKNCK